MDAQQILILIGFAIYYFIRANSKKEQDQKVKPKKRPQQRTKPTPQRSIEDILRDLAGDQVQTERKKEIFVEPEVIDEIIVETPTENQPRRVHVESTRLTTLELDDEEEEESSFDLRQAVINDAILNRPHQW